MNADHQNDLNQPDSLYHTHHHRSHQRNHNQARSGMFNYSPSHYSSRNDRSNSPYGYDCGGSNDSRQSRRHRSLSPNMVSLNRDLEHENFRPRSSRSGSRSSSVSSQLRQNHHTSKKIWKKKTF